MISYPSLKHLKFKSLLKYYYSDDWSTITIQRQIFIPNELHNSTSVQHALQSMTFFLEYIQLHTQLPHIQNAEDLTDWFIIQQHFGQSMSINTQKGYKKYNMWHRRMYILHNSIAFSFSRRGRRGRTFEYTKIVSRLCLRVYIYTFMLYILLFLLDGPCNPV